MHGAAAGEGRMADAREGLGRLRILALLVVLVAGVGLLPTRAMQPVSSAAAQDDEDSDDGDWSDDEFVEQLDAEPGNDFGDDDWAGEYEESDDATEADDAIPVDDETWGEDVEWDVSAVVEVFDKARCPEARGAGVSRR
jgi:hypothetical protein